MKEKNEGFRALKADEIECRVATVKQPNGSGAGGGCSLLLYKDARVDMRLLDERYGAMGWQRHHRSIDGRLYCTIAVRDSATGEWIEKEDVGTESYTEKEKGQASDSFKRAGFCWGIGRELYTAPFIWINLTNKEWRIDQRGSYVPKIDLDVKDFEVKDGQITKLTICDRNGEVRFRWSLGGKSVQAKPKEDDAEYDLAVQRIKEARSPEELTDIWNDCILYHERQDFIDALNKRLAEIQRAA